MFLVEINNYCVKNIASSSFFVTFAKKAMKYIACLLSLFVTVMVHAVTFDVDGLRYEIISQTDRTVSLAIIPKSISYPSYSTYTGDINVPATVTFNGITFDVIEIGENAFSSCYSLGTVTIPASIKTIGFGAFSYSNITHIELPAGLESIGSAAFSNSYLEEIVIPENCNELGSTIFNNCRYLKKVVLESSNLRSIPEHAFENCISLSSVNIPSTVTSLGEFAFRGTSSLENITIPEQCNVIGQYCFYKCGVTSLKIPDNVTELRGEMFRDCKNLQSIELPPFLSVNFDEHAFRECISLKSIKIPEGVDIISPYCFRNCSTLCDVQFPSTLKQIGNNAFAFCPAITSLTIPEGVTTIDNEAFYGTSISELSLPSTLQTIGDWAFGIKDMKKLVLPASLIEISIYAFDDCVIPEIYCQWENPISCKEIIFHNDTYLYGRLYVPEGSLSKYKSVQPWNAFFNISEYPYTSVDDIPADTNILFIRDMNIQFREPLHFSVYDINGALIHQGYADNYIFPKKGMYILQMGNEQTLKISI